jgi:hypothetical protein
MQHPWAAAKADIAILSTVKQTVAAAYLWQQLPLQGIQELSPLCWVVAAVVRQYLRKVQHTWGYAVICGARNPAVAAVAAAAAAFLDCSCHLCLHLTQSCGGILREALALALQGGKGAGVLVSGRRVWMVCVAMTTSPQYLEQPLPLAHPPPDTSMPTWRLLAKIASCCCSGRSQERYTH